MQLSEDQRDRETTEASGEDSTGTELSRRRLVLLAGAMGAGLAVTRRRDVLAQDATETPGAEPDPEPDPEADPEAEVEPSSTAGGTPVGEAGDATIYCGRNETLVGPLLTQLEGLTGVDLDVRYGDSGELAATILEEGDSSPASVFFSQDAGLLGLLAGEGRLAELPADLLERVDPRFRSPDGLWVGLSGRARVLVYNTDALTEADLPTSVLQLTDPKWSGKIGWAPTNASFQSFVTALRLLEGEDAARTWLEGIIANEPEVFDGNAAVVRAVGEGELEVGLVNHYYLYEIKQEEGDDFPIANHFFSAGDPGSLVNVAGVGLLASAPDVEQGLAVIDALLSTEAQTYFAEKTFEYPLIEGVPTAEGLPALSEIESPDLDLSALSDLAATQQLLADVGLI